MKITAQDVLNCLAQRHSDRQWVFFPELIVSTGCGGAGIQEYNEDSRLDAWAMNLWPSRRLERITYEIKVERSDWRKERAKPKKRQAGLSVSNRFYYVAPKDLLDPREIPRECGLITVQIPRGRTAEYGLRSRVLKEAPWRDTPNPDLDFWASVCRRIARVEGVYE